MMLGLTTRVILGAGSLVVSVVAGGGVAAADVTALTTSTCTYPQVMAALNAQFPAAANELSTSPMANSWLQQLLASPPDERAQMVAQVQGMPALQEYLGIIPQVANTCGSY